MQINISSDIERVMRRVADTARAQIPFAAALAMTRTAKAAEKDLRGALQNKFDAPTQYITRGTFITPAKKTKLEAWVGMKDQRSDSPASYVAEHFGGGERGQKPYERALTAMGVLPPGWKTVPGSGIKLNRNGNPQRAVIAEVLGALKSRMSVAKGRGKRASVAGYFVVKPGATDPRVRYLKPGIWRREQSGNWRGRTLAPVFLFERNVSYAERIDLKAIVDAAVKREFPTQFNAAITRALATAGSGR